jgi:hypothetical protein
MTRRDWYVGVVLVVAALLFHAAVPRYAWRDGLTSRQLIRLDRWTGSAALGRLDGEGRWVSLEESSRQFDARRKAEQLWNVTHHLDSQGLPIPYSGDAR